MNLNRVCTVGVAANSPGQAHCTPESHCGVFTSFNSLFLIVTCVTSMAVGWKIDFVLVAENCCRTVSKLQYTMEHWIQFV